MRVSLAHMARFIIENMALLELSARRHSTVLTEKYSRERHSGSCPADCLANWLLEHFGDRVKDHAVTLDRSNLDSLKAGARAIGVKLDFIINEISRQLDCVVAHWVDRELLTRFAI